MSELTFEEWLLKNRMSCCARCSENRCYQDKPDKNCIHYFVMRFAFNESANIHKQDGLAEGRAEYQPFITWVHSNDVERSYKSECMRCHHVEYKPTSYQNVDFKCTECGCDYGRHLGIFIKMHTNWEQFKKRCPQIGAFNECRTDGSNEGQPCTTQDTCPALKENEAG